VRLDICHVLPALHFLTGSDCTSKFGTKHAAIINTPNSYLANFGITGANNKYSIEEQIKLSEEYLVQVLKRGSHCKTMDELRLNIYTQSKNVSIDKLPPTSKSVKLHILRAFYHTHLYQNCLDDNINHIQLDPTHYGYEDAGDCLHPVRVTTLFPDINELVPSCSCLKCARESCLCF
jgi:hypothetical protein